MARAKNARPRPCQAGDQYRASHQGFLPRQLAPQVLGSLAARDFTHRAPHVQAVARWVLPGSSPSLGAAGGRGGNLLAAGSNRLQTRFRRLHTGFWTWLYRFDAGPGPEGHLDPFMSAGSRGQLAPGPAAESLPPANWLPCSPTGPLPPSLFLPPRPANWLASPVVACRCVWPARRRPRPRRRFHQVPLDAQLAALPSRSSHQESLVFRSHPPLPPRRCRAR